MPKPPRELVKQIEVIAEAINNVSVLIDDKKIRVENYGKDFLEPLTKIRVKAIDLRNDLELFKYNMERALTDQYYTSDRFANKQVNKSAQKVIKKYLSSNVEY